MQSLPALSRFELHEELGSGTTGTVYRAVARERTKGVAIGDQVAIKFLRQDLLADEEALSRFLEEGRIGMSIRSPYVVRIFSVENVPFLGLTLSYLVMELVQGRTVRRLLAEVGPPVEHLIRRIGREVALGLHVLHSRRIVHRDLKPENICLTDDGRVKLMDLGLARQGRILPFAGSSSESFFGSVGYAAPEALRSGRATPGSDLYALGVVLYELATGRHPFVEPGRQLAAEELIEAQLRREAPPPARFNPRISAFLERLILNLLDKDPVHRIGPASRLAKILGEGEASSFWRENERRAPMLSSARRVRNARRFEVAPFLGRELEIARLVEARERTRAGKPLAVLITGPSGVGKRRIALEAVDRWLSEGEHLVFFAGRGGPPEEEGPAAPFGWFLVDWLLQDPDLTQPVYSESSPALAERFANRLAALDLLPPAAAEPLVQSLFPSGDRPPHPPSPDDLAYCLRAAGRDGLLCLLVDRVDSLRHDAVAVLERLLAPAGDGRILVFVVHQEERSLPAFLEQAVSSEDGADIGSKPDVQQVRVGPLPPAVFADLCSHLFELPDEGRRVGERFFADLGGNPGHLAASLEVLAHQGRISGKPSSYRLEGPIEQAPLPAEVARLYEGRVRELPAEHRNLLDRAAILGDRFLPVELEEMTGLNELLLLQRLSELKGSALVLEGHHLLFTHRAYRDALLRLMPL
jgi:hypothetical protein